MDRADGDRSTGSAEAESRTRGNVDRRGVAAGDASLKRLAMQDLVVRMQVAMMAMAQAKSRRCRKLSAPAVVVEDDGEEEDWAEGDEDAAVGAMEPSLLSQKAAERRVREQVRGRMTAGGDSIPAALMRARDGSSHLVLARRLHHHYHHHHHHQQQGDHFDHLVGSRQSATLH